MSDVVKLYREGEIGIVVMEEREYKNTFSKPFIKGLMEVFEAIGQDLEIKVVVIHGYDNYFCCGGTKEELLEILEGKVQFTDLSFHDLLLQCEVPVIAAMQGQSFDDLLEVNNQIDDPMYIPAGDVVRVFADAAPTG